MKIAFFGTPNIAVIVLNELKSAGILPSLIVSNPDAPIGRKQILTPPPVVAWAKNENITILQPDTLKNADTLALLTDEEWDMFIVVAYGKILPQWLIDKPKFGTLNVHPSLLPKLRGASPIRSAILTDQKNTGVTIMLMDDKMDHGPILMQSTTDTSAYEWPIDGQILDQIMAKQGGEMLATVIPKYISGEIKPSEQDHTQATFCTKISKEMSELQINPYHLPNGKEAYENLLKIRAFSGWPETFFIHEGKRIKIKAACLTETGRLSITRIIPEGKSEMDFGTYFK